MSRLDLTKGIRKAQVCLPLYLAVGLTPPPSLNRKLWDL